MNTYYYRIVCPNGQLRGTIASCRAESREAADAQMARTLERSRLPAGSRFEFIKSGRISRELRMAAQIA